MYKSILVPTDGSKLSAKAVKEAINFAKSIGARITAIYVTPPVYEIYPDEGYVLPASVRRKIQEDTAARSKAMIEGVRADADAAGVQCEAILISGSAPYEAIIKQAAKSRCDLIMMASHGRSGLSRVLLGSETAKYSCTARFRCWSYAEKEEDK